MLYTDKRDFSTALNVIGIVSGIILGGLFSVSYIDVVGTNLAKDYMNTVTMLGLLTLLASFVGIVEEVMWAKLKNFREISYIQLTSSVLAIIIIIFVADVNLVLLPQLFFFASGVVNYTLKNA